MTKHRQDPALRHLHCRLHLRFVFRLEHPSRDHNRTVMRRQLFVRPVDPWLVTVHQIHAALQVVRNPDLRTATEVIRHPLMGLRPRFQRLVQCRFDVGVTARAQRPDEQLHFDELSHFRIDDVRLLPAARKIDECLLACSMPLTHRRVQLLLPLTVQLAITGMSRPLLNLVG